MSFRGLYDSISNTFLKNLSPTILYTQGSETCWPMGVQDFKPNLHEQTFCEISSVHEKVRKKTKWIPKQYMYLFFSMTWNVNARLLLASRLPSVGPLLLFIRRRSSNRLRLRGSLAVIWHRFSLSASNQICGGSYFTLSATEPTHEPGSDELLKPTTLTKCYFTWRKLIPDRITEQRVRL